MTDQTDSDTVPVASAGENGHGTADPLTRIAARPLLLNDDAPAGASTGEEGISTETDPATAGAVYRLWGWPVSVRGDQIWLALDGGAVALVIPALVAADVATILSQRRCPPLVLAHPYGPPTAGCAGRGAVSGVTGLACRSAPGHRRHAAATHRHHAGTGHLGPLTAARRIGAMPGIDVRTALRTALSDPPPRAGATVVGDRR